MTRPLLRALLLAFSCVEASADPSSIVLTSGETKTRFAKLADALAGATIESAEVGPPPALLLANDRDSPRLYRALTDGAGAFRIDAVMPGERRLRVHAAGYPDRVVTVPGVEFRKTARIRVGMTR